MNTTSGIVKKVPQNVLENQENAPNIPQNKIEPPKAEDCLKALPKQVIKKENEAGETQKKSASQKSEALKMITQQFMERTSLNKEKLKKLRGGQKYSNEKSDNAKQAAHSEEITRLKEKKKFKEELCTKILEKLISGDVPKEAQDDTGIQTSVTRQDDAATEVIKVGQKDNAEPGWESDIEKYIEVSPEKGEKLLEEIFVNEGSAIEKNNEAKEQENVACIMQCLFKTARAKDQTFDEGTYIVEDPEKLFFNFLRGLEGSYRRISSHKVGDDMSKHYGFDVPKGWMNPSNKQHILFFSTKEDGKDKLFLKPENYGTKQWGHFFLHAFEYVESLAVRSGVVTHDPETQVTHRKERPKYLPDNIKNCLTTCVDLLKIGHLTLKSDGEGLGEFVSVLNPQELDETMKIKGIACVIKKITGQGTEMSGELSGALEALKQAMEDKQLDHLDERAALEVRFDKKELIESSAVAATTTSEAPGEENKQALRGTKNGNRLPEGRGNQFSLNPLKRLFGGGKLSKAS